VRRFNAGDLCVMRGSAKLLEVYRTVGDHGHIVDVMPAGASGNGMKRRYHEDCLDQPTRAELQKALDREEKRFAVVEQRHQVHCARLQAAIRKTKEAVA
jgi:hypothetical protein